MYSGGFKVPEELLHRHREISKDQKKTRQEVTEQELEEQRQRVLNDLNLSLPGGFHERKAEQM